MSLQTTALPTRPAPAVRTGHVPVQFVPLDVAHVRELAEVTGLCVTLYVGSLAAGPLPGSSPLLDQVAIARHAALTAGHEEQLVDEVLAPVIRLATDMQGWTTSSPSMAVCVGPGFARALSLPLAVAPHVAVGEVFRVHPLVATRAFKSSTQVLRTMVGRPVSRLVASASITTNPADIERAAGEGRIAKLFVGVAMPVHTRDRAEAPSLADHAITATLRAGGRVRFVPVGLGPYALAAALR